MKKMTPKTSKTDVGAIVGRFQVHELHEAHRDLIDTVLSMHDRVIIFVGLSPLRNTINNPLDFASRKKLLHEAYRDLVEVYYIADQADDAVWSANLDRELNRWLKPHQTCTLYGSRESFIPFYSGKYPVQELESTKFISGTELRNRIANNFPPTKEFRAGVISAAYDRYPTCFPTVDIAIMDWGKNRMLLGKKAGEPALRFIGGFVQPGSRSLEENARREVMEETGVEVDDLQYAGSTVVEDWRYRKEVDKIMTTLFVATYIHGRPEANDDIAYVEWVSIPDVLHGTVQIMPEHKSLVELLGRFLAKRITTTS